MTTPPPDLAAIRERAEKATEGPWTATDARDCGDNIFAGNLRIANTYVDMDIDPNRANRDFIAHARTDIPALLDHIARFAAERDAANKEIAAVSQVMCGNDRFPGNLAQYVQNEVDGRRLAESERDAAVKRVERLEKAMRAVLDSEHHLGAGLVRRCIDALARGDAARGEGE